MCRTDRGRVESCTCCNRGEVQLALAWAKTTCCVFTNAAGSDWGRDAGSSSDSQRSKQALICGLVINFQNQLQLPVDTLLRTGPWVVWASVEKTGIDYGSGARPVDLVERLVGGTGTLVQLELPAPTTLTHSASAHVLSL